MPWRCAIVGQIAPGVSFWGAYTYSHSLDGQSAFLGDVADPNFPQNSHDIAAEHGPSSFDMRNRFVAAYVLSLPRNNRWTRNTDFQGIVTAESGQPFTPTLSPGNDNSNTGKLRSAGRFGSAQCDWQSQCGCELDDARCHAHNQPVV